MTYGNRYRKRHAQQSNTTYFGIISHKNHLLFSNVKMLNVLQTEVVLDGFLMVLSMSGNKNHYLNRQ